MAFLTVGGGFSLSAAVVVVQSKSISGSTSFETYCKE